MDYWTLTTNSNNDDATPIAMVKDKNNTIIDLKKKMEQTNLRTNLKFPQDILPIPYKPKDQTIRYYISGMSGSGKTTFSAKLLESYHKIYPKDEIILFTALEEDPIYDKNKLLKKIMKKIIVSEENIEEIAGIREDSLANSICIFDDYSIYDTGLRRIIETLKDTLLRRGRHYNISVVVITQKLLGGTKTITELQQCNFVVVFPLCSKRLELDSFYKNYAGFSIKDIEKLHKVKSRHLAISMIYPKYVIANNEVLLMTEND